MTINLEEYIDCFVDVERRDGRNLYGVIKLQPDSVDGKPFCLDLGDGGICYSNLGRCLGGLSICDYDIIKIEKLQQPTEKPMTEQIKVEGDTITYNGVKYQKVGEPEPETLRGNIEYVLDDNEFEWDLLDPSALAQEVTEIIVEWLPTKYEISSDEYMRGWNDYEKELLKIIYK